MASHETNPSKTTAPQVLDFKSGSLPTVGSYLKPETLAHLRDQLIGACVNSDLATITSAVPLVRTLKLANYGVAQCGNPQALVDASVCIAIVGAVYRDKIGSKHLEELRNMAYISGQWDRELAGVAAASCFAWGVLAGGHDSEWGEIKHQIIITARAFQAAPTLQALWLAGLGVQSSDRKRIADYLFKIAAVHSQVLEEQGVLSLGAGADSSFRASNSVVRSGSSRTTSYKPVALQDTEYSDDALEYEMDRLRRFAEFLIKGDPLVSQGLEKWYQAYLKSRAREHDLVGDGTKDLLGGKSDKLARIGEASSAENMALVPGTSFTLLRYMGQEATRILDLQRQAAEWTEQQIDETRRSRRARPSWFDAEYFDS